MPKNRSGGALLPMKNRFGGVYFDGGEFRMLNSLTKTFKITKGEAARLADRFSSILSKVRKSQVQSAEVISHGSRWPKRNRSACRL